MTRYMIHTMPKRLWYVNEYLIPSMIKQGVEKENIVIQCDDGKGCLESCMEGFDSLPNTGGTWHIQDDVIIASNFKQQTEQYNNGIVCGFCCIYDDDKEPGIVSVRDMWWSFPCIRIPNHIANECAEWYYKYLKGNKIYDDFLKDGVNDDWVFRHYVWDHYKELQVINLAPNLVDHIDWLIGGTVNSSKRIKKIRSKYWNEESLVKELENKLCHKS